MQWHYHFQQGNSAPSFPLSGRPCSSRFRVGERDLLCIPRYIHCPFGSYRLYRLVYWPSACGSNTGTVGQILSFALLQSEHLCPCSQMKELKLRTVQLLTLEPRISVCPPATLASPGGSPSDMHHLNLRSPRPCMCALKYSSLSPSLWL